MPLAPKMQASSTLFPYIYMDDAAEQRRRPVAIQFRCTHAEAAEIKAAADAAGATLSAWIRVTLLEAARTAPRQPE